jgi:hypothetical protein
MPIRRAMVMMVRLRASDVSMPVTLGVGMGVIDRRGSLFDHA